MDKVKLVKLGNWVLLFPTHPSWIFLHFLGLACFFHILDNSLMIFPICEVLDRFGSALATYGSLLYFGKSSFFIFMIFLHTNRFYYEGCTIYVHYYSSLFNGRIHTNIHFFIHVIWSLLFSLFFLCMLVRILSSKIYFLCFFLASLLISLIYYFYMVSKLQGAQPFHLLQQQGWSSSTKLRSPSSLLSLSEEELV